MGVPNYFDFVGVELVRIDAVRGFERDVTVIDYATARSDGSLEWKGRGPNWKLAENGPQLSLRPEQGVWVARDQDGNIVDPVDERVHCLIKSLQRTA